MRPGGGCGWMRWSILYCRRTVVCRRNGWGAVQICTRGRKRTVRSGMVERRRKKEYDGDKKMMCFFWCEIRRFVKVQGASLVYEYGMVYGMSQKGNFDRKMIIIIIIINNQHQSG